MVRTAAAARARARRHILTTTRQRGENFTSQVPTDHSVIRHYSEGTGPLRPPPGIFGFGSRYRFTVVDSARLTDTASTPVRITSSLTAQCASSWARLQAPQGSRLSALSVGGSGRARTRKRRLTRCQEEKGVNHRCLQLSTTCLLWDLPVEAPLLRGWLQVSLLGLALDAVAVPILYLCPPRPPLHLNRHALRSVTRTITIRRTPTTRR